jgi:hypothetical protein
MLGAVSRAMAATGLGPLARPSRLRGKGWERKDYLEGAAGACRSSSHPSGMFKASFVFVVLDCCLDMLLKDVPPTVVSLNAKLNLEKAAASLPCARKIRL